MVKLILYYTIKSPPSRAVMLCAKALGIDLELKNVDLMQWEQLKPDFLKLNPQHTIPVLDDNGIIIWDSHAIMAYLADKYASDDSLYPKDLVQRAYVNQRLIFNAANLFERIKTILRSILYFGAYEIPQDRIELMHDGYDSLEALFDENLYLLGNQITIADFAVISNISSIKEIVPINENKFPGITGWVKRMEVLPYYEDINQKGATELVNIFYQKMDENKANSDD